MRRLLVAAWLVGIVVGCSSERKDCDEVPECEECRMCAAASRHACRDRWRTCSWDPQCSNLDVCIAGCFSPQVRDSVGCERTCRGQYLGGEPLYDDAVACVDDTCTLACED